MVEPMLFRLKNMENVQGKSAILQMIFPSLPAALN